MKHFLVNLLIVASLGLCALAAFQWHREGQAYQQIQTLTDTVHNKDQRIIGLEGDVKRLEAEVTRLDRLKSELTDTVKSNRQDLLKLAREAEAAHGETERQLKQMDVYKEALQRANDGITKQNEDIKRQNGEMQKLAEDRNDFVEKYNKVVTEFNDLAKQWNALQEKLAQAGTNAPSPAK